MRLFWRKGRKIRSTERLKTSAILNARFRESYFKLKVNGRAVTSQGSRRDQRIKRSWRREVELDPQLCPEEIMSREVALG